MHHTLHNIDTFSMIPWKLLNKTIPIVTIIVSIKLIESIVTLYIHIET